VSKHIVIIPLGSGAGQFRTIWPAEAIGDRANIDIVPIPKTHLLKDNPFGFLERDFPDVVVTQVPVSVSMLAAVNWLKSKGVRVVLDFDDDTSAINPQSFHWSENHPAHSDFNNWHIEPMIAKLADLITVTTKALYDKFSKLAPTVIIPNCVPKWYFDIKPKIDQWGVGWSGNIAIRPGDLAETHGALSQYPFRWTGAGQKIETVPEDDRKEFALRKAELLAKVTQEVGRLPSEVTPWLGIDGEYQQHISSFKVGIVPLIDNHFNNCKSALTGLTFAALGVPFVATPTDPYLQLNAGLYASRNREWRTKVGKLLNDDYFWESERERNLAVAKKYVIEDNAQRWLDAWNGTTQP